MPTIEYYVEGATEKKYINDFTPELVRRPYDFEILEDIDKKSFEGLELQCFFISIIGETPD
jgi:hypothetical protein